MVSKIFMFICAIIGFIVIAIFGIGYFAVNRAMNNSDAKIFATQVLSQVAQEWNKDKLLTYLDYEYAIGWTKNLHEDVEEIYSHRSKIADIDKVFAKARDVLGNIKSIRGVDCVNFSNRISCYSAVEFEKGKAMLAFGLRRVSETTDGAAQYKVNMFAVEDPAEAR